MADLNPLSSRSSAERASICQRKDDFGCFPVENGLVLGVLVTNTWSAA